MICLDVSRIMTNKFAITLATLDLSETVDECLKSMIPLAASKEIHLRSTPHEPVMIEGDAARLRQVLSNLLVNAIKFTPSGGLIETRLFRNDSWAVLEVSDTGEGISAQFLPHLFERRMQAVDKRFGGLGLGLSIVKHITELHRGSVSATSEGEGKGATFTVRLPSL